MSLAYQDMPITELSPDSHNQAQLFDRYLDKMFSRRPAESQRYPKEKALHCLTWLAKQMQQRGQTVFLVERLQPDWMPSRLGYLLLNVVVWSIFWLGIIFAITQNLWHSLKYGMILGFFMGIDSCNRIVPMEMLNWSWDKFWREGWKNILIVGLVVSLIDGLLVTLLNELFLLNPLLFTPLFLLGLIASLPIGLLIALLRAGLENQIPEKTASVNQGIMASFHNAWYFGILFGLVMVVVLWFSLTTIGLRVANVSSFLYWLFGSMLINFLWLGGYAVVQHFILRIMLWLEGYTPFNFVGFLDTAARLILLRKVGGGYVFVHRLLLEHLARRSN